MLHNRDLTSYILAVLAVMAAVLVLRWLAAGDVAAHTLPIFFAGFLMGMIAICIATHVGLGRTDPVKLHKIELLQHFNG